MSSIVSAVSLPTEFEVQSSEQSEFNSRDASIRSEGAQSTQQLLNDSWPTSSHSPTTSSSSTSMRLDSSEEHHHHHHHDQSDEGVGGGVVSAADSSTTKDEEGGDHEEEAEEEDEDVKMENVEDVDDDTDNELFDGMEVDDGDVWEDEEVDYLVFEEDEPPKVMKKTEEQFFGFEKFAIAPHIAETHKFYKFNNKARNEKEFLKAYQREIQILEKNLPDGMLVKGYESRMDLFSALIVGPKNSPYEDGIFAFDIKLPEDYPHSPPKFYFISFTRDRLNPNLYAHDGKVCVSLLGTWRGSHQCEKWTAQSTLLQVLVSIQGLILVPEPYFNEPGTSPNPDNPLIVEQSKNYNERATVLMLQSTRDMLEKPPFPWQFEITYMLKAAIPRMLERYELWSKISQKMKAAAPPAPPPPQQLQLEPFLDPHHHLYLNLPLLDSSPAVFVQAAAAAAAAPAVHEPQDNKPVGNVNKAEGNNTTDGAEGNNDDKEESAKVPDFPLLPFAVHTQSEVSSLLVQLKSHHAKYCSI